MIIFIPNGGPAPCICFLYHTQYTGCPFVEYTQLICGFGIPHNNFEIIEQPSRCICLHLVECSECIMQAHQSSSNKVEQGYALSPSQKASMLKRIDPILHICVHECQLLPLECDVYTRRYYNHTCKLDSVHPLLSQTTCVAQTKYIQQRRTLALTFGQKQCKAMSERLNEASEVRTACSTPGQKHDASEPFPYPCYREHPILRLQENL